MSDLPPMSLPTIAVYNSVTGELRDLAAAGNVPKGYSSCALPTGYNEVTWRWSAAARAMIEDAARVEVQLIAEVKAIAETSKMAAITRGFGKSEEYKRKAGEAAASATVLAATLNALSKADAIARFPAAWHEAQLSGEQLAVVLARYRARSAAALGVIDRMSAIEQVGVARIKAATTAATKRAAAAAISWTWSPA